MRIRAIIWDMGGVLLRTEDYGPRRALAGRVGLALTELESRVFESELSRRAAIGQVSYLELWEQLCVELKLPPGELDRVQAEFWGGDRVDADLMEYVRGLRPQFRTAVLSNAWSDMRQVLRDRWKILDAFDEVIISSEVGLVKPDPRVYELAVRRLGVAPGEAVFIDDFPINVQGARESGLHALQFRNSTQVREELDRLLAACGSPRIGRNRQ